MYKAIFFDLDGTLVNTLEDLQIACNYALNKFGFNEVSIDFVKSCVGDGIRKLIERVVPENATIEEIDGCFKEFQEYYRSHLDVKTYPYDGIIDLLKYTKSMGMINVIVSNKFIQGVETISNKFFKELIDLPLGPNGVLKTKPDLSMIDFATKKYGLKKEEILYIGDSLVDIITAHKADIKMITVTYGFRTKEELVKSAYDDLVFVDHPSEIIKYLE